MTVFPPLPLGQRIPDSLHGVSCSLPDMRAVIGYETKDPAITRHLTSGYPRFVYHPLLKQAGQVIGRACQLGDKALWLTSSPHMAALLQAHLAPTSAEIVAHEGIYGVAFVATPERNAQAKTFLQNIGGFLSSRQAEDFLARSGTLASVQAEALFSGDASVEVNAVVARAYGHSVTTADIFLAPSGMNAVYAAFRAVEKIQRPRGRTKWLQLGWLYLDTIAILQKLTGRPGDFLYQSDVFNLAALRKLFSEHGSEIAGIITEVPTNPLIQTADVAALYQLAQAHGIKLILDPTITSPLNIDILPYADLVVNSLTKYTASEGDVLLGAVIVNPQSADAASLRSLVAAEVEPVYSRDMARLAAQIGDYESVINQINRTAPVVVDFLRNHPNVAAVHWSLAPASRENYLKIARHSGAIGSVLSFEVKGPLERFYDRVRLPKGPSFGMKQSLLCPFIYLAHYDLVTSAAGREKLQANGINPDLLRLSIGCEPAEEIIAALAEALD